MSAARLAVKFSARCRCLRSSLLTSRRCAQINYYETNWSPALQLRSYPLHHENTARNSFSSSPSSSFTKTEYIHPLSQIVLEHLQNHHSEWVQNKGLDQGLELKKDGTFILRFPQAANTDDDSVNSSRGSIWTMYEAEESKHYLCIRNGNLVGRYMLQDNKKPAWHTDKRSTPERVQDAVDEMILKMEG
mmetsp:Transcript_21731/g.31096  ORF Transcript_21731/g.31096 Transcript_21731/m.31096 type:complete len:189 (-) Transcript_21731:200-766(-)